MSFSPALWASLSTALAELRIEGPRVIEELSRDGATSRHRVRGAQAKHGCLIASHMTTGAHDAAVERMAHEMALGQCLSPAFAACPIRRVRSIDGHALVLHDPGGDSLDTQPGGPMGTARFMQVAGALAAAVQQAHTAGLVHRDLRPCNILVSEDGAVHLTGFGHATRRARESQAGPAGFEDSAALPYMSPEQTGRMNRSVDSRSDLYSLGVVFYQMLTGDLPFVATGALEWVHCHVARPPIPVAENATAAPAQVIQIVFKLLAKAAEDRYQTAAGLVADLQRCALEWAATGAVRPFALHQEDIAMRLVLPEKLYGRRDHLGSLLDAHRRVSTLGRCEWVLVSGPSGVGKSSLVGELQRHTTESRGHFASGKFEQNKTDIPYSTLAQSLQGLFRSLLSLTDAEMAHWRQRLSTQLGANGALLANLVPELPLLLGPLGTPPTVSPTEAAARFQLVVRKFLAAFASEGQPLVLFIDDLQWLDTATLELLQHLLTHDDVRDLLLVGAYRSNEVDTTHPLRHTIDAVRAHGVDTTDLSLDALTPADVEHWVADALPGSRQAVAPLAAWVHDKTRGNPFFTLQLLRTLGEEGLLHFNRHSLSWAWDLQRIGAADPQQDVADFMREKLRRLPPAVRALLELIACFGSTAGADGLALATALAPSELAASLAMAEDAGLIGKTTGGYQFVHDRIQEAAYALIPVEDRSARHLDIARRLRAAMSPSQIEANLFDLVNQLAAGAALIGDLDERTGSAGLFLQAGRRAKSETAYRAALVHLARADALLEGARWTHCYALAMAVASARAECEFLLGNLRIAEAQLASLRQEARGLVDLSAVSWLQVTLYTALDQSDRAIETCLDFLRCADVQLPRRPAIEEVRHEYELLMARLGDRGPAALLDLPPIADAEWRGILDVLTAVLAPAFFSDENLVCLALCRMANLSLSHGNGDGSPLAYAYLGMVVGPRFADYPTAFAFGQVGYELVERGALTRYRARVYMCFAYHVSAWARPLRSSLGLLRRAYEVARENGDVTYAGFSSCTLVTSLLSSGEHLASIQSEGRERLRYVTGVKFGLVADIMTVQLQLVATLRGETPSFGVFDDAVFSERDFEAHLRPNRNLDIAACWYWIRKAQARLFAGQYAEALAATENAEPLLWTSSGHFELAQYHLCGALVRAAACQDASPERRAELLRKIEAHLAQLRIWARHCPETFAVRVDLIEAEIAKVEGRTADAMQGYERALAAGRADDGAHTRALTLELSARFYATLGLQGAAGALMAQARDSYARWGAHGKVRQLEAEQPALRSTERPDAPAPGATFSAVQSLDAAVMAKTSEAVSGEVGLEKLMRALMVIALEHAGANRGLLILPRGEQLRIEAHAESGGDGLAVQVQSRVAVATDLPLSVLNVVVRTQRTVLLDDAKLAEAFASDPYFADHPCESVLCLPLLRQGELVAVLYLENHLMTHVFTQSRVALLNLVASTAALSMENALLEEKESLLKEVHHRVKNNLQLISSLLSLQASRIDDPAVSELFKESRNRVRSMALVHENLYRAGNFARVPMPTHVQKLCAELSRAYGLAARRIETTVEVDELQLDLDRAISCGLIINELVSNALKHAFPDGRSGTIAVRLRAEAQGMCQLSVADDGVGLPADIDVSRADSLGLQLVDDLTAQLGGELTVESRHGARFSIRFRAQDVIDT